MVGYDPNQVSFTKLEQFGVGAATSISTRFLIQPLDVVKIRFQLQHEAISKKSLSSKYTSIPQCVRTIYMEEGLFGLWKGHLSGQILSFSFVTTQFLWFQQLTKASYSLVPNSFDKKTQKLKPSVHFFCGGLAAGLTVLNSQPLDVIRTRLVAQGEPRMYKGMADAARKILAQEGIRGLYKGTIPCICLTAPEAAFRFGIYQFLSQNWEKLGINRRGLDDQEIGMVQSTVCGGVSGICAKTAVYPFDLIKKRLIVQGFEEARVQFGRHLKFTGMLNCLFVTVRHEGVLGLYKGYLPSLFKAWVSSGLTFFFYEKFSNITRRSRHGNERKST